MVTLERGVHGILILVLVTGVAACATPVLVENPSQPISEFKLRQNEHGVEIAIDPVIGRSRLEGYFVKDLLRDFNILPLFIVIRNQQDTPILVRNGSFAIIDSNGRSLAQSAPISTTDPLVRGAANKERLIAAGLLFTPLLVFAFLDRPDDYRAAADNIQKRALFDRVLYKGEDHRGFVYFGLQDNEMIKRIAKLQVEIRAVTTDQTLVLMFDLDLAKEVAQDERAAGK